MEKQIIEGLRKTYEEVGIGKWLIQNTSSDMTTYALIIGKLKNNSWSVIAIDTLFKKPAKKSTKGWFPVPKEVDRDKVPEKLRKKVFNKASSLGV